MKKTLVAYFSASGVTAKVAAKLAEAIRADLDEIQPAQPYTRSDLNWMDKKSRSSVEMNDRKSRPAIANRVENMAQYDTVFVGFPIWYYSAPNVIHTFCKKYDWEGKKLFLFATSGGSEIGKTSEKLKPHISGAEIVGAKVFRTYEELWAAVTRQ